MLTSMVEVIAEAMGGDFRHLVANIAEQEENAVLFTCDHKARQSDIQQLGMNVCKCAAMDSAVVAQCVVRPGSENI